MSEREQIIEKIRKLLRMKRGGTPGEIANALRMAQEIATKNGINLADVNPDDEGAKAEQPLGHQDAHKASRFQKECVLAGMICNRFFNVRVFRRAVDGKWSEQGFKRVYIYALTFVGTAWDTEIALYVYHFLVRQFRYAWEHKSGRARNREAFMWGFYIGVFDKLEQQMPKPENPEAALVIINQALARRESYIEKHFGKLEGSSAAPDTDAQAAIRSGIKAGLETDIRKGVKGEAQGRLMLA
jgi:hypothetical protein